MSSERMKLAGLDELPRIFGEEGLGRLSEFLAFMGKVHHGAMPRKHWYRAFIGVEPVHQGQGIGSSLLRPMLARADAEGLPCYLETFLDTNVPFYKRNGFDLIAEGVEPTSKCRYWTFLSRKR
jgi:GNAT superfamily N-acetyltransferase